MRSALSRYPARERLTLTVRYLGGAEAWVEIKARGETFRFPGHRCMLDALEVIWAGEAR